MTKRMMKKRIEHADSVMIIGVTGVATYGSCIDCGYQFKDQFECFPLQGIPRCEKCYKEMEARKEAGQG